MPAPFSRFCSQPCDSAGLHDLQQWEEVCSSTGELLPNRCALRRAMCENPQIREAPSEFCSAKSAAEGAFYGAPGSSTQTQFSGDASAKSLSVLGSAGGEIGGLSSTRFGISTSTDDSGMLRVDVPLGPNRGFGFHIGGRLRGNTGIEGSQRIQGAAGGLISRTPSSPGTVDTTVGGGGEIGGGAMLGIGGASEASLTGGGYVRTPDGVRSGQSTTTIGSFGGGVIGVDAGVGLSAVGTTRTDANGAIVGIGSDADGFVSLNPIADANVGVYAETITARS